MLIRMLFVNFQALIERKFTEKSNPNINHLHCLSVPTSQILKYSTVQNQMDNEMNAFLELDNNNNNSNTKKINNTNKTNNTNLKES